MKDCLNEKGAMKLDETNIGGWNSCDRRTWCNSTLKNAIPTTLLPIFKTANVITGIGGSGTTQTVVSNDIFFLPAFKEITGEYWYHSDNTETVLFQLDWFKTKQNRKKKVSGAYNEYWTRSAQGNSNSAWLSIGSDGDAVSATTHGGAPRGISAISCI